MAPRLRGKFKPVLVPAIVDFASYFLLLLQMPSSHRIVTVLVVGLGNCNRSLFAVLSWVVKDFYVISASLRQRACPIPVVVNHRPLVRPDKNDTISIAL